MLLLAVALSEAAGSKTERLNMYVGKTAVDVQMSLRMKLNDFFTDQNGLKAVNKMYDIIKLQKKNN